jgi:hypothetical protein
MLYVGEASLPTDSFVRFMQKQICQVQFVDTLEAASDALRVASYHVIAVEEHVETHSDGMELCNGIHDGKKMGFLSRNVQLLYIGDKDELLRAHRPPPDIFAAVLGRPPQLSDVEKCLKIVLTRLQVERDGEAACGVAPGDIV